MIHPHEDERQATLALGHEVVHRRSRIRIPEASMTVPIQQLGLADLIRSNRLIIELRLTTPSELASITGDVTGVTAVKGFIRGWQAITIRGHKEGVTSHHIVGSFEMRSRITSDLRRLAPDLSLSHMHTVARALNAWDLVERYGLEVMPDDEFHGLGDDE